MTPPQRIGVLTFHRCINYGSYWQARCLVEGLRKRGHDAVLLDHQSSRINLAEWRCALRPVPEAPRDARYRAKTRKFFAAFEALPLSPAFPLQAPEQSEPYDLVLVGSDEVWNLSHPWYGGKALFYGEGLRAGRIAAYAASFGNQSGALDPYWSAQLSRFDAISVRDRNSQDIVETALGMRPPLVLDPVLQFAHLVPKAAVDERPYALVYGHGFPDWLVRSATGWAQRCDLQLLSVGYDNSWADMQHIDAGPLEFAALMVGAAAVITNFFHGCVFAVINGKPFATAPSDYRFNKVRDLVAALGAEAHMVSESADECRYDHILTQPLDPLIARRIASLRAESEAYLDAVLA